MLESNGNMYMPVAPAYSYGNGSNGMFGGDWACAPNEQVRQKMAEAMGMM